MRLVPDHSGRIVRRETVTFTFGGETLTGHAGETVAAALWRAGRLALRTGPADGRPRGAFCCIGLCQECLVLHDGRRTESCRLALRDGMHLDPIGAGT